MVLQQVLCDVLARCGVCLMSCIQTYWGTTLDVFYAVICILQHCDATATHQAGVLHACRTSLPTRVAASMQHCCLMCIAGRMHRWERQTVAERLNTPTTDHGWLCLSLCFCTVCRCCGCRREKCFQGLTQRSVLLCRNIDWK